MRSTWENSWQRSTEPGGDRSTASADDLRRKIRAGEYASGQQLPSERELVDNFGASRVTVRQAIAVLRTEGLFEAQHGRGLFVRNRPRIQRFSQGRLTRTQRAPGRRHLLPRTLTKATQIEEEDTGPGGIYARLEDAGHRLGTFVEHVTSRMPTPEEAVALQLGNGSPVLEIVRIARDTNGTPVEVNEILLAADRFELTYELPAVD